MMAEDVQIPRTFLDFKIDKSKEDFKNWLKTLRHPKETKFYNFDQVFANKNSKSLENLKLNKTTMAPRRNPADYLGDFKSKAVDLFCLYTYINDPTK
jgi:hypothetical protein